MRARPAQFEQAQAFLKRVGAPVLVIPGNHDVPLYNVFARAISPFANYLEYIEPLSTNPLVLPHVAFLGLNTVNPLRHQQGIVREADRDRAVQWLGGVAPGLWRVLVVHQHFANVPGIHRPGVIPNAGESLRAFAAAGTQAILYGHTHYNRVTTTREFFPEISPPIALVCVGTATSERTRGEDRTNSYNVLQFTAERFVVRQCNWDPATRHFAELRQFAFERKMFTPAAAAAQH